MGNVGRPKKLDDYYMKQLAIYSEKKDRRSVQNFHYMAQAYGVLTKYIEEVENIQHIEILFEGDKFNSVSCLVELGRLHDFIINVEEEEVSKDFFITFTKNVLLFASEGNLKSKQLEQIIRDKKSEVKALYRH